METKLYIGVDPGKSGAVAVIDEDLRVVELIDFCGDIMIDGANLKSACLAGNVILAAIEQLNVNPNWGRSSCMEYGGSAYGPAWVFGCLGIPHIQVRPKAWQDRYLGKGRKPNPKEMSLSNARRRFPDAELHLKKHDGRADALHIAWWARDGLRR